MNEGRLDWDDVAKGLGILAVVAGHIFGGFSSAVIYIFHIPFFFFISGYLYRRGTGGGRSYLSDKALHLLVPYGSFLVLLYGPPAAAEIGTNGLSAAVVVPAVMGGRFLVGWVGIFWFVTCLFAVQQSMNALLSRCPLRTVAWTMLLCLAVGYVNSEFFPSFWLPWNLNVVFAACPFFFAGHLARTIDIDRFLPLYLLGAVLAVLLLAAGYDNTYDMKSASYGIPVVTFLSAISLIGVLLCLARRLSTLPALSRVLSTCGEASMLIMFLHQPLQMTLMNTAGLSDKTARFAAATCICILAYRLLSRSAYGRALLLGSAADFRERLLGRARGENLASPLPHPTAASSSPRSHRAGT